MGIKVAQFNVLLELQLITSLVISQIPVESANTRVGKSHIWEGTAPSGPPLNPPMLVTVRWLTRKFLTSLMAPLLISMDHKPTAPFHITKLCSFQMYYFRVRVNSA